MVVAVAGTPETVRLIGAAELAAMRAHACLINVARGIVVDEAALSDALRGRRIAGAGLDVFVEEPLPADSQLWRAAERADHAAHRRQRLGEATALRRTLRRQSAPLVRRSDPRRSHRSLTTPSHTPSAATTRDDRGHARWVSRGASARRGGWRCAA